MGNVETNVLVEHPNFGVGEIEEIHFDDGGPIIHVNWRNGQESAHGEDELEFFPEFVEQTRQFDV